MSKKSYQFKITQQSGDWVNISLHSFNDVNTSGVLFSCWNLFALNQESLFLFYLILFYFFVRKEEKEKRKREKRKEKKKKKKENK